MQPIPDDLRSHLKCLIHTMCEGDYTMYSYELLTDGNDAELYKTTFINLHKIFFGKLRMSDQEAATLFNELKNELKIEHDTDCIKAQVHSTRQTPTSPNDPDDRGLGL